MQFPASDKLASTPFAANPPTGIAISIPSGIYSSSSIGLDYTDSPATLQPSSPSFTIPLDSVPTTPQTSSTPHLDTPLPPPLTHLPPLAPEPATLVSPASPLTCLLLLFNPLLAWLLGLKQTLFTPNPSLTTNYTPPPNIIYWL